MGYKKQQHKAAKAKPRGGKAPGDGSGEQAAAAHGGARQKGGAKQVRLPTQRVHALNVKQQCQHWPTAPRYLPTHPSSGGAGGGRSTVATTAWRRSCARWACG